MIEQLNTQTVQTVLGTLLAVIAIGFIFYTLKDSFNTKTYSNTGDTFQYEDYEFKSWRVA